MAMYKAGLLASAQALGMANISPVWFMEMDSTPPPTATSMPPGSVARGQALVTTGGNGKTVPCIACHGVDLKGLGDVPHIAGLSPVYAIRQLNDFKVGDRAGTLAALMKPTVANLTTEDMVDIVAYLATLDP